MNMVQGETATPSRSTSLRGSAECKRACERITSYLSGTSRVRDHRALHAHLNACSDCNEIYRSALLSAARHGREMRGERELRTTRDQPSERAVPAAALVPRKKRAGMKVFVLAALGIALLSRAFPAQTGPNVELLAGHASVGDKGLTADGASAPLRSGDWLTTEAGSRARIAGGDVSFELGPSSRVRVVDPERAEVRLDAGELWVDGACTVTSEWGWVQVDSGRAHFVCEDDDVLVESISAPLIAATGFGEQRLAAGGAVRLATVGR